jgi:hypothetical protein
MKKEVVNIDYSRIEKEVKELEALVPQIELLRQQATVVLGTIPESISGEKEVHQHLTLSDYPNASTSTASELMGVKNEYNEYMSNLRGLGSLEDYELNEEGKVSVKASKLAEIKEESSLYLSGDKLKVYKQSLKVCEAMDKLNECLANPIGHRLISVDYKGKASVNVAQILWNR